MCPSSTSSSSWRRYRAAILTAVILLALEFVVVRSGWIWSAMPKSKTGVFAIIEKDLIGNTPVPPTVLLIGSSRMMTSVDPRQLEKSLGLPERTAFNLGLTGGRQYDNRILFERSREALAPAKVAIISIDDWDLDAPHATDTDRRYRTITERFEEFEGAERDRLIVGWAWETYDARKILLRTMRLYGSPETSESPFRNDGTIRLRDHETNYGPRVHDTTGQVDRVYRRFRRDDSGERDLARLIDGLRKCGMKVLVVRFPCRASHETMAQERFPEAFNACRTAMDAHNCVPAHVPLLHYRDGGPLGIPDEHFYDYGHLALAGRRKMTEVIAHWIRTNAPEVMLGSGGSEDG